MFDLEEILVANPTQPNSALEFAYIILNLKSFFFIWIFDSEDNFSVQ